MTVQLTDNAQRIFDMRWSRKDERGDPTESFDQAVWRVANNVASVTALYERDPESMPGPGLLQPERFPYHTARRQYDWLTARGEKLKPFAEQMIQGWGAATEQATRYHDLIGNLRMMPNSPTWTGAGTPLSMYSACFVVPIADDLVEGRDSIMESTRVAAAIQQRGGGVGYSFSRLRPKGSLLTSSMGRSSGPVTFMRMYDTMCGTLAQGGARKGAQMAILRVDHPDIREFIRAKTVEGQFSNFNISVGLTNAFMAAVEADEPFGLIFDGEVHETVDARELWDELVRSAWELGDPGCFFIDRANERGNPVPHVYAVESTNPCGEELLGPYGSCTLGSVSLAAFVSDGEVDWGGLADAVSLTTQFLDDVVDANGYIPVVPELEEAAQGTRRIGLGIMGLADMLVGLGIRYGTPRAQDFAGAVMEWVRYYTMAASIERASQRGPFPYIEGSVYDPDLLVEHGLGAELAHPRPEDGYPTFRLWDMPFGGGADAPEFGRPRLDWGAIAEGIVEHGIRNSSQNMIAPTGTTSNVAGCEGSGCEPLFALAYQRRVVEDGGDVMLDYLSPLFEDALATEGLDESERETILVKVKESGGSCQGVEEVPQHIRGVFAVAADVAPADHVRMQAALQEFLSSSVSKTINMPNEATVSDVEAIYRLADNLGCVGITIYRQGSRQVEVLSTEPTQTVKVNPSSSTASTLTASDSFTVNLGRIGETEEFTPNGTWPRIHPMPMPPEASKTGLPGIIVKVATPVGSMWATITEHPHHPGRPFDVRLQVGKAGNDKLADVEGIGRAVSLALRGGVGVAHVVEQLEGVGGQGSVGFGENRVRSVADGLAKVLRERYLGGEVQSISEGEVDVSRVCPECHNHSLVYADGCLHCETRLGGCGNHTACD